MKINVRDSKMSDQVLSLNNNEIYDQLSNQTSTFDFGPVKCCISTSVENLEFKVEIYIFSFKVVNQVVSPSHPYISIDPSVGIASGHLALGFDFGSKEAFLEFNLNLPFGKSIDFPRTRIFGW